MCGDHPRRAFGGLYHCAKFGWNRGSSFDNMHVFRFCEFGLKRLFTPQNWGFLEENRGRDGATLTPDELVLTFGGLHVCVQFGENRRRNATVRVSTDGHTHTHTRTDAKRFYYLSHAICYSYGADKNSQNTMQSNSNDIYLNRRHNKVTKSKALFFFYLLRFNHVSKHSMPRCDCAVPLT